MKTYYGWRSADGSPHVKIRETNRALKPRLDLHNHSPDGFEWNYGGSGPAQLALALLADVLADDRKAQRWHQPFKWAIVARLPKDGWTLTTQEIRTAVARLEAEADEDTPA